MNNAKLRQSDSLRRLARETHLGLDQVVLPLYICEGRGIQDEIPSLPGQYCWSRDIILEEIEHCLNAGLRTFLFYPKLREGQKDRNAGMSDAANSFYLKTLRSVREVFPEANLIGDLSLSPYNLDGQNGLLKDGQINVKETLALLSRMALAQSQAGANMIAASGMMDGQVSSVRENLDAAGFVNIPIMAYPAKFASAYYKPHRDFLEITPKDGERETSQTDPANKREAILLAKRDAECGADVLVVEPALHSLDLIEAFKQNGIPVAAHHSSGEFAMLMAGVDKGWVEFVPAMNECLLSIKRAGADFIITCLAKAWSKFIHEEI